MDEYEDSELTERELEEKTLLQKTLKNVRAISKANKENKQVETQIEQLPVKSNMLRNVLIGAGVLATYLLFKGSAKASEPQYKMWRTDMLLTKNFQLSEFLISSDIPEIKEYKLNNAEMRNVVRVATLLQELRDKFGPITITSGGRPNTLKNKEGKTLVQILTEKGYRPSAFSQHMDFSGADFTTPDRKTLKDIYKYLLDNKSNQTTQVILYIENGEPDFIHLGVPSDVSDFSRLPEKHLIGKVTVLMDDNGKRKKDTKFLAYNQETLDSLLA